MPEPMQIFTFDHHGRSVPDATSPYFLGEVSTAIDAQDNVICVAGAAADLIIEIAIPNLQKITLLYAEIITKAGACSFVWGTTATATAGFAAGVASAWAALPGDWVPLIPQDLAAAGTLVWDKGVTVENNSGAILYLCLIIPNGRAAAVNNNAVTQYSSWSAHYDLS